MNSVFVNPGIYSCTVDAFLEISTHLFLPYIYQTYVLGMSLQTCFSMFAHIITFGYLKEEEESPFMTLRTLDSFCRSCSSSVTLNLQYIYGLNQLGLGNNMWPFFVVPISRARKNPLTTIISSDTIRKLNLPYETISVKCIILERNKKKNNGVVTILRTKKNHSNLFCPYC